MKTYLIDANTELNDNKIIKNIKGKEKANLKIIGLRTSTIQKETMYGGNKKDNEQFKRMM